MLRDGLRTLRQQLPAGHNGRDAFMLQLASATDNGAWSNDALVEFEFYDSSHWSKALSNTSDE